MLSMRKPPSTVMFMRVIAVSVKTVSAGAPTEKDRLEVPEAWKTRMVVPFGVRLEGTLACCGDAAYNPTTLLLHVPPARTESIMS